MSSTFQQRLQQSLDQNPTSGHSGLKCSVAVFMATLDEDDAQAVRTLVTSAHTARWVCDRLADAAGVQIAVQTMARHRRGDCRCVRDDAPE